MRLWKRKIHQQQHHVGKHDQPNMQEPSYFCVKMSYDWNAKVHLNMT